MPEPRFPGKTIVLGGKKFVVPAIALGKLRELQPRLAKLNLAASGMPSPEDLDTIVDMTLAALNRNYPEMTKEEVDAFVDLENMPLIIEVVTGQAGLDPVGKPELEQASP